MTDLDDVLRYRLATLKAERDRARAALERAKEQSVSPIQVDPALVERFSRIMKENFTTGSMPFRKSYLQSLISTIEIDDDEIRIKGSKDLLEKAVLASQSGPSKCSQMSTSGAPEENYIVVHSYSRFFVRPLSRSSTSASLRNMTLE